MLKTCLVCHIPFDSGTRRATCSEACWISNRSSYRLAWNKINPDKNRAIEARTRGIRNANGKAKLYQVARRSSKAGYLDRFLERVRVNNPNTDLTREYLATLFGDTCAVTSVPFKFEKAGKTSFENPYSPSIDRIDSTLPYQAGNIQIVLTTVNLAKNAMSMADFTKVWSDITKRWFALTGGAY